MKNILSIQKLTAAALLIAVGILIPMFAPKISMEPVSFTLFSHVAVMLAMFISPGVAAAVTVGTTLGFLLNIAAYGPIIVLRAASHIVFVLAGAIYLKRKPAVAASAAKSQLFSFIVGLIHALCEVAVVSAFFFGGATSEGYYKAGFLRSVLLLIGAGSVVHSMVDFAAAWMIYRALSRSRQAGRLFIRAD